MRLRDFLLSALVFSAFIVGFGLFANDFGAKNGVNFENKANMSVISQATNISSSAEATMRASSVTGTPLDLPLIIVSGVFVVLKSLLYDLPNLWATLVTDIGTALNIPPVLIGFLTAAIAAIIVFEVIKVASNRDM